METPPTNYQHATVYWQWTKSGDERRFASSPGEIHCCSRTRTHSPFQQLLFGPEKLQRLFTNKLTTWQPFCLQLWTTCPPPPSFLLSFIYFLIYYVKLCVIIWCEYLNVCTVELETNLRLRANSLHPLSLCFTFSFNVLCAWPSVTKQEWGRLQCSWAFYLKCLFNFPLHPVCAAAALLALSLPCSPHSSSLVRLWVRPTHAAPPLQLAVAAWVGLMDSHWVLWLQKGLFKI